MDHAERRQRPDDEQSTTHALPKAPHPTPATPQVQAIRDAYYRALRRHAGPSKWIAFGEPVRRTTAAEERARAIQKTHRYISAHPDYYRQYAARKKAERMSSHEAAADARAKWRRIYARRKAELEAYRRSRGY